MHHGHEPWHTAGRRKPGGGGYFGRGGVKFAILELLTERPRHGYDIMREMEERSGGAYSPSPGVIYPTLQALEDQDYVKSAEQDGKKVYSITESGLAYLEGHKERMREQGGPRRPGGHKAGRRSGAQEGAGFDSGPGEDEDAPGEDDEDGPGWRYGTRSAAGAGTFGAWFFPTEMPELMKELRWLFGDFAGAFQRTVTDPHKIKEIREVLREAKSKIDEIVSR